MGLPLDVTEAEVAELFGKCGLIKVDEKGAPRIKLYRCGARRPTAQHSTALRSQHEKWP